MRQVSRSNRHVFLSVAAAACLAAIPYALATNLAAMQRGGGAGGAAVTTTVDPPRFHYMGPATAGRIAAVVGIPGDPSTYYLGSASGGVWKSTDNGQSFIPVFDDQPVQAIGALAIAPSQPTTVWAGTGEAWIIRPSDIEGDGVYKSTDAGETWKNMGLHETGRIGRIVVHPTNPNIVFVCAVGRANGPQEDRGVFRTTDGGANWTRVLFVNPDTGCSGLSIDQADPNTLLAGTWQVVQHTWGEFSGTWAGYTGTPGSGVYISHDGGTNWKKIEAGMPKAPVGKIDVAIAASDSKRMYALIQTADQGSLWRSDDAGTTWNVVSWDRSLIGRAGYYIRLGVNPQNPDDLIVMNSGFHRSNNGGKTFAGGGGGASCGDCHDVWFDSKNPARYALTDDGGAEINTGQGGVTRVSLPNGQMYHVATDNRTPYWIYSNRQDDGTMRGPSTNSESTGSGILPPGSLMTPGGGGRGGGGRGAGGGGGAAAALRVAAVLARLRPLATWRALRRLRPAGEARQLRRLRRAAADAAVAATLVRRGNRTSAVANQDSRFRIRPTRTSCGRPATATSSRDGTRARTRLTPSSRG